LKIFEPLSEASVFAGARWRAAYAAGRKEESELWSYLGNQFSFVHQLGQAYQYEDYVAALPATSSPYVSAALDARPDSTSRRALALALKALEEAPDPDQARHLLVLVNLWNFLADTGQTADVEDYFTHHLDYAPLAIASFATFEEAEAWLMGLEKPPSPARILIGDTYYLAWYSREDGARNVTREFTIEPYIEGFVAKGIPPSSPSFMSREDALAWLEKNPASPFAFLSIAGEHYFAVHHKRLKRHTLHPVALSLKQWEEEKKAAERQSAQGESA
jgi:hypothetical protein